MGRLITAGLVFGLILLICIPLILGDSPYYDETVKDPTNKTAIKYQVGNTYIFNKLTDDTTAFAIEGGSITVIGTVDGIDISDIPSTYAAAYSSITWTGAHSFINPVTLSDNTVLTSTSQFNLTNVSYINGNVGIGTNTLTVPLRVKGIVVTGRSNNNTFGDDSVCLGGYSNSISVDGDDSAIIGGGANSVTDEDSAVLCGTDNSISRVRSVILGGTFNDIGGSAGNSTISAGSYNTNNGVDSLIGSGNNNTIYSGAFRSFIGSGRYNEIYDDYSFIGCGASNTISADYSSILGVNCNVSGEYGIAMGKYTVITGTNTFAYITSDIPVNVSADDAFVIAGANVGINSVDPSVILDVYGDMKLVGNFTLTGAQTVQNLTSNDITATYGINATTGVYSGSMSATDITVDDITVAYGINASTGVYSSNVSINGNIGIGTTAPNQAFHIVSQNNPRIKLESPTAGNMEIEYTGNGYSNAWYQDFGSGALLDYNNTTGVTFEIQQDGDVIIHNGNFGIGTTAPTQILDIAGSVALNDNCILGRAGTDPNHGLCYSASIDGMRIYGYDGVEVYRSQTTEILGFWDDRGLISNTNVGIGTSATSYALHVIGNIYSSDLITSNDITLTYGINASTGVYSSNVSINGNIGIGTTAPVTKLEVDGIATIDAVVLNTYTVGVNTPTYVNQVGVSAAFETLIGSGTSNAWDWVVR
jgi:hypothetical protein